MDSFLSERQEAAVQKLHSAWKGIAWWKMGEGKTRIALAAFLRSKKKYCLVVVRRPAIPDFIEEMSKVGAPEPLNRFIVRSGKHPEPRELFNYKYIITTHHSLFHFSEREFLANPYTTNWLLNAFVIVDELWLLSNHKSKMSKACHALTKHCKRGIGLSGTVMPAKNNLSIYGQLHALNQHAKALRVSGSTEFITQFQEPVFNPFGIHPQHRNREGSYDEIMQRCEPYVDVHFPERSERNVREKIVTVPLTEQASKLIKTLKDEYFHSVPNSDAKVDIKHSIEAIFGAYRMSNGWIKDSRGSTHFIESEKINALIGLIQELHAAGEQVLVWTAFKGDIKRIQHSLKIPSLAMSSEVPLDRDAFKSGEFPVVIATEASGSSIDIFASIEYVIYFSQDYKWVNLQQSRARTDRRSSQHDGCFYYYLHSERPAPDKEIYNSAQSSGTEEQTIINILNNWK